jgi:hypothetical protein
MARPKKPKIKRKRDRVDSIVFGTGTLGFAMTPSVASVLSYRHGIPPFSFWNTQLNNWQKRRRNWLRLGIQSEIGRPDGLTYGIPETLADGSLGKRITAETSIFDPCICELCYEWWCPPAGVIIDPFAGGNVRGVVASIMGFKYWGCELRKEQVDANRESLKIEVSEGVHAVPRGDFPPKWVCGDSLVKMADAPMADFLFTCPPYANLEVYSDLAEDISNKEYPEFAELYQSIMLKSFERLKDNRFAVIVIQNIRDPKTKELYDLVGDTTRICKMAGLKFYNEIILMNRLGTNGMRSNGSFLRGHRKVVRCHQNILVYVKGDPAIACKDIPIDCLEVEDDDDTPTT